jgi:mono/diheme cytochrome c family protein
MIIPRSEGDLANGEKIYQKQCAGCHGKTGKGGDVPDAGRAIHQLSAAAGRSVSEG